MFSSREPATGVVCGPTRCHRCRTQLWMSWPGLRGEASTHGRWRETIASLNYAVPDSSGRATQCSHSRAVVSAKTPCVTKRAPRILSSYLRTSNYSSAHLTRMNDIVKVSSSASGSRGASRTPRRPSRKTTKNIRLWNAHQVRTSPRRYSVGPNRHGVRSSAQQLSHESTCSTRLHQDLTARRVAPRSRAFVSAGFGCAFLSSNDQKPKTQKKLRGAVPGRETCLPRLNVVNTEFQLRHLIIWSCIVIHVSSESKRRRRIQKGERRDEKRASVATDILRFEVARTSRGRRVRLAIQRSRTEPFQSEPLESSPSVDVVCVCLWF